MVLRKNRRKSGQAVVELAIFGAILIFVLGGIIRQAMGFAYQQNQQLKAMRLALTMSQKSSDVKELSRVNASVMFIEDRLTTSSTKFGTASRVPYMVSGSGTHSAHMFKPLDYYDDGKETELRDIEPAYTSPSGNYNTNSKAEVDLALFDLFVNGKHFSLTTSRFKKITIPEDCPEAMRPNCPGWKTECQEATVCTQQSTVGAPAIGDFTAGLVDGAGNSVQYNSIEPLGCDYTIDDCWACATYFEGCFEYYAKTYNGSAFWCDYDGPIDPPPDERVQCVSTGLSLDARFDLDQSSLSYPTSPDSDVPDAQRKGFSWQWYGVGISLIDPSKGANVSVDIDGDLKEESIIKFDLNESRDMWVLDLQDGDIDMTYNTQNYLDYTGIKNPDGTFLVPPKEGSKPQWGFLPDVTMYAYVSRERYFRGVATTGGTYFIIEEGKLFDLSKQYVRDTQKKDNVDIIERILQLSNDTDRFCDPDGQVTPGKDPTAFPPQLVHPRYGTDAGWTVDNPNPVEVCCNSRDGTCYDKSGTNVGHHCHEGVKFVNDEGIPMGGVTLMKTCMDEATNIIYIRSRLRDKHGHRWVTDISQDESIDFKIK